MNCLGIELGSTRIKAVVIDANRNVIKSAAHSWESRLENGYWTYSLDDVWTGLRDVVSRLDGIQVDALGVSAMMHGYLVFDTHGELLVPFRTWKNTNTTVAASTLSGLFNFNIPERWSVAHLYQAILNGEEHVKNIAFITTLAGYVHWKLTGRKVLGIGDASGMFPIENGGYNSEMVTKFKQLTGIDWSSIAPQILKAGEDAGMYKNIPLCPPEGDAGTGMVATSAIAPRTGNVSAGTSVFAMVVLERPLKSHYPGIDIVTTPWGLPVAMVHANECCSLIDPWVRLFGAAANLLGAEFETGELFAKLYESALDTNGEIGKFMREKLALAVSELRNGMKILTEKEEVRLDYLAGHGGYFKSGKAGQAVMSEMLGIPVKLVEQSAEGGAFGCALLAAKIGGNHGA
ncbi:ATPase [Clostridia bacterium]|nr:ATPase [Clostridia bacterium]